MFFDVIKIVVTYKIVSSVGKQKHESLYNNNFSG